MSNESADGVEGQSAGPVAINETLSEEPPLEVIETSEPGVVLMKGDLSLLDFDIAPVTFDPHRRDASLVDVAAVATGVVNTAAQLANGVTTAHGLVRLAPETLAALKAGAQPLSSGGWNLGSLTQGGKISHAV